MLEERSNPRNNNEVSKRIRKKNERRRIAAARTMKSKMKPSDPNDHRHGPSFLFRASSRLKPGTQGGRERERGEGGIGPSLSPAQCFVKRSNAESNTNISRKTMPQKLERKRESEQNAKDAGGKHSDESPYFS